MCETHPIVYGFSFNTANAVPLTPVMQVVDKDNYVHYRSTKISTRYRQQHIRLVKSADMLSSSTSTIIIHNHILPGDIGSNIQQHGILYAQAYGFDSTFAPYAAIPLAKLVQDGSEGNQIWIA